VHARKLRGRFAGAYPNRVWSIVDHGKRGFHSSSAKAVTVRYLSDVNMRAVLTVLISRAGGTIEVTNAELYDAMLPGQGMSERFLVEETDSGIRLSVVAPAPENS
jgi:hypothetical protein